MSTPNIPPEIVNLFAPPDFGTAFVAPADDASQKGIGSATNPYRVSGEEAFDSLMQELNAGKAHRVHLYPGVYFTRGSWNFRKHDYAMFNRPISLTGEGMDQTTIRLSAPVFEANSQPRDDASVLRLGAPQSNNGSSVLSDMTIDGNEEAFRDRRFILEGVLIFGNNSVVRNVRVMNLRGLQSRSFESFAILLKNWENGPFKGPDGGSLIENCEVIDDGGVNNYFCGIYMGYTGFSRGLMSSCVRNCRAIGTGSKPSNVAFAFNCKTIIRDCSASNFSYALYNDFAAVEDVLVDGCMFSKVRYTGLQVTTDLAQNAPSKKDITLANSTFDFEPTAGQDWIGICVHDKKDARGTMENILVDNCTFKGGDGHVPSFCLAVIVAAGARNVRFFKNLMPPGTQVNLKTPTPSTALSYTSNRLLNGMPVTTLQQIGAPA